MNKKQNKTLIKILVFLIVLVVVVFLASYQPTVGLLNLIGIACIALVVKRYLDDYLDK